MRTDLRFADFEARRFIQSQLADARKLGYPTASAFAKDMARGSIVSLIPTAEDEGLDKVGQFYWKLSEIERRVIASQYGETFTSAVKARRINVSTGRFYRILDRVLHMLKGYLQS